MVSVSSIESIETLHFVIDVVFAPSVGDPTSQYTGMFSYTSQYTGMFSYISK